jgi:nucleoid-associated protein YgaU
MPAALRKPFEIQFVVKASSWEAAERIVNAAIREAREPEKETQMSEYFEANSVADRQAKAHPERNIREHGKQLVAPHTPVDANRGTRIPAADQRDAKNEKPA